MRTFLAVSLPPDARSDIAGFVSRIELDGDVRWVPASNLHITLRFLGDVEPSWVEGMVPAIDEQLYGRAPFSIRLAGFGAFPTRGRPRVLWVGVRDGSGLLEDLAAAVDRGLAAVGVPPENRPFRPHVTVGRGRDGSGPSARSIDRVPDYEGLEVPVDAVTLYQSQLPGQSSGRRSPEYRVLERMELHENR